MRASACAREKELLRIFSQFKILAFGWRFTLWFLHLRACTENNTSFYEKQHVTLKKTTRHFEENDTSFYAKQHVTLKKTTRHFFGKVP